MKLSKIFFVFTLIALVFVGCDKAEKKKEEAKIADNIEAVDKNVEKLALNISGMTCEIGCAKTIESKLSKQDGVLDAKVVFSDSIAKIEFDPAKTNKAALMSFVGGIADNMYTVSEAECKKSCDKDKKECDKEKSCDKDKKECDKKKSCDKEKKSCDKDKKECDKSKKEACSSKDAKECPTKKCAEACKSSEKSCSTSCTSDCCA